MGVFDFASGVHDVIWSGLIASTVTIFGVLLANWSSTGRLKMQLRHESEEKAKQRKAELRKDVYISLAEKYVKANAWLSSIPERDLTDLDAVVPMADFIATATQLQIIGEIGTATLVSELLIAYNLAFTQVIRRAVPLKIVMGKILIAQSSYDTSNKEVEQSLAAMKAYNQAGVSAPNVFADLNQSFSFAQGVAQQKAAEVQRLFQEKLKLQGEFVMGSLEYMEAVSARAVPVIIALREELDLPGSIDVFEAQMKKQQRAAVESTAALFDELRQFSRAPAGENG